MVARNSLNSAKVNFRQKNAPSLSATTGAAAGAKALLLSIHDMIKECLRTMAQQRHEEEKKEKMMSDWKVAAAVIDRFCFILITLFFIGGTLALIILRFLPQDLDLPDEESSLHL